MTALILVDLQNDFMPGGALPVAQGNEILPAINDLLKLPFDLIVATQDWHPSNHGSFAEVHQKKVGQVIDLDGIPQILWPTHCVQGTKGASFYPGWDTTKIDRVIHKGTEQNIDSYSTFFDNGNRRSTGLDLTLKEGKIHQIYLAGLATDYCVKYSVLDAVRMGFEAYVVLEGCRGVNLHPFDSEIALEEMKKAGAQLITLEQAKKNLAKAKTRT